MNTTANTVASKLFVAFVATAMLFTLATPAKAQTAAELQAQINTLMAQIAALSGTPASSSAACTFTRSLTIGSEGADVKCLQDAMTPTYFNNAGGSTGYFGPVTAAAVAAWQTANGIAPAVGFFGPMSQAKFAMTAPTTPTTPTTPGSDDSDDDDDSSTGLSGEATLDSFDIEDGDDTEIEEGQEAESVLEFVVNFEDGDAEITRLDVELDTDATDDIWDVLSEVTLSVDGEVVETIDASDEDSYQSDDMTLRISGLNIVAMEDEDTTITLGVTVQGNLDDNDQTVTVDVTGMRFVDGDDVTTTETEANLETAGAAANTFDIDAEGSEDELIVKSATSDPDADTLVIDDQTTKSDWYTVFAFDLDTDDSTNDIELNNVGVQLTVAETSDDVDNVVQDAELVIDGEVYDDFDWSVTTGTSMTLDFDIDGDHTIDAGDRVTAELKVRFYGVGSGVDEGTTLVASASTSVFDVEGADDVTTTGGATGETHTLRSAGVMVDAASVESEESTQGDNDTTGIFELTFDVTALEGDFYINDIASSSATAVLAGVDFDVEGPGAVTSATGVISSTAEDTSGAFLVREGETETFTLTVTIDAGTTGQHRVILNEVWFSTNSGGITSAETVTLTPAADYRTDYENINAS